MKRRLYVGVILFGIFISIAIVPFMEHYNPHAGIIKNISTMQLNFYSKPKPWFDQPISIISKSDMNFMEKFQIEQVEKSMHEGTVIELDNTNIFLIFPKNMDIAEINKIIMTTFTDISKYKRVEIPEYSVFEWQRDKYIIRYKHIFLLSLILLFGGIAGLLLIKNMSI